MRLMRSVKNYFSGSEKKKPGQKEQPEGWKAPTATSASAPAALPHPSLDDKLSKLRNAIESENKKILSLSERVYGLSDSDAAAKANAKAFKGKNSGLKKAFFEEQDQYSALERGFADARKSLKDIMIYYSALESQAMTPDRAEFVNDVKSMISPMLSVKNSLVDGERQLRENHGAFLSKAYDQLGKEGYKLTLAKKRKPLLKIAAGIALPLFLFGSATLGYFKGKGDAIPAGAKLEERVDAQEQKKNYELLPIEDYASGAEFGEDSDDIIDKGALSAGGVPILMYHKIGVSEDRYTISPERFRSHLEKLYSNGFRSISLQELKENDFSKLAPGAKPVLITFDDADKGQFEYLEMRGEPVYDAFGNMRMDPGCAVAIMDDFVASHPDFRKNMAFAVDFANSEHEYEAPFLQEKLVKQKLQYLVKEGYEIMNHTFSHIDVVRTPFNKMKEDIERAKKALEFYIGENARGMNVFVFPYGSKPNDPEKIAFIDKNFDMRLDAWGGAAKEQDYTSGHDIARIETGNNLDSMVIGDHAVGQRVGYENSDVK